MAKSTPWVSSVTVAHEPPKLVSVGSNPTGPAQSLQDRLMVSHHPLKVVDVGSNPTLAANEVVK